MSRARVSAVWQAVLSAATLIAASALYGPQNHAGELTSFLLPTGTPRVATGPVVRLPTPTSYIPTATPPPMIHVVQKGDVLGLIAALYGTTEDELVKANNMKSSDDVIVIGQELIIAGAHRTPVPLQFSTPTATPTATSIYVYPAPVLLSPTDGAALARTDSSVTLQWSSVGVLAEGEWYEVRFWQSSQDPSHATRFRTHSTAWAVPASLSDLPSLTEFRWQVLVVYAGRTIAHRSPLSAIRRLVIQ